jgi:hypothetical protein
VGKYVFSKGELSGRLEAFQHHFENSNALSQFGADLVETVSGDSPDKLAKSILRKISSFEQKWGHALSEAFEKLNDDGLNRLMRKTPLGRKKIDWDKELASVSGD